MSTADLTLFSYEILALVGQEGAGAHDLLTMARKGRMLVWAGESRYYTEPKRLARLGYLDARTHPGRTRERTVYSLNAKGLAALQAYARTPVRVQPLKTELLLRVLMADLVGEAAVRESIGTIREDVADLLARVAEREAHAERLPHRRKYLRMNTRFLRRWLELHLEFVDEVERELDGS